MITIYPDDYRTIEALSGKKLKCITNLDLKIRLSGFEANIIILKLMNTAHKQHRGSK
jgi:hypothetical protein